MAEIKKRKVPSAEFKEKVGLEAVRGIKAVNQIAQQHGVDPVMESQSKKEILVRAGTLFEGKRDPKAEAVRKDEDRLYGEIGRLKMKLDRLKRSQACKRCGAIGMAWECWRDNVIALVRASRYRKSDRVSPPRSGVL